MKLTLLPAIWPLNLLSVLCRKQTKRELPCVVCFYLCAQISNLLKKHVKRQILETNRWEVIKFLLGIHYTTVTAPPSASPLPRRGLSGGASPEITICHGFTLNNIIRPRSDTH